MSIHVYRGVLIERTSTGGFRWISLIPGVGIYRADSLQGIKRLITEALAK